MCRPLGQLRAANAQEGNVQTVWEPVAEEAGEGREEDQVDNAAFEQRAPACTREPVCVSPQHYVCTHQATLAGKQTL